MGSCHKLSHGMGLLCSPQPFLPCKFGTLMLCPDGPMPQPQCLGCLTAANLAACKRTSCLIKKRPFRRHRLCDPEGQFGAILLELPRCCCVQDADSWEALFNFEVCWISSFYSASHTCSYSCFLSRFAPWTDAYNGCWLAEKPQGAPGSYCNM